MPANQLPLTFSAGTLPGTGQGYTPQQLLDFISENARIFTGAEYSLFSSGSTAPTSDTGPWLSGGSSWYYWDADTGSYVPMLIPQIRLKYYVGVDEPDPDDYLFWIQTEANGDPRAVKTYYNGAWTDVYANALGSYLTISAFNAAIANYSTTEQMNEAISTALTTYPARAELASPQTVAVDGSAEKVNFNSEVFDPEGVYNAALSRYIAPVDGIYLVSADLQVDNDGGTASGMELGIIVSINGAVNILSSGASVASPPGSRWYPDVNGLVELSAGDYIEVFLSAADGVNVGNVEVGANVNSTFCIHLVQRSTTSS